MDPMDYILHNPPRLHSHSETMAQGSGSWMSHGHLQPHTSPNHWSSHPPPMQPSFSPPRSHHYHQHHHPFHHLPGTHPFMGHSGGLPLPDPSFRSGFLLPDPVSGLPVHSRHWNQHIQPPMPGPPHAVPLGPMHMNGNPSELSFGYMGAPGGRNQQFVPPAEIGLGPPGATSEPHTLPRPLMPPSAENSANSFGHQLGSQLSAQAPPFASTSQRRGGVHSHSSSYPSSAPRAHRNSLPQSTFESASSDYDPFVDLLRSPHTHDRRRSGHSRARRSMNARQIMSDPVRDNHTDINHTISEHGVGGSSRREQSSDHSAEDATVRQMQVLRGALSSKMVASRAALQSLQSIDVADLPENERTCVICYNDFGVETPEGINEAPLQLPKCKHVFGDHCIKKWFEDSDSCPYCRDKLHSEPKQQANSARAFMNIMRMRAAPLPPGLSEEVYVRLLTGLPVDGDATLITPRQVTAAERRSLPDDAEENQRRTRQRRNTADSPDPDSPASDINRPAPFTGTTSPPAPVIPSGESLQRYAQWVSRSIPGQRRPAAHPTLHQDPNPMGPGRHGSGAMPTHSRSHSASVSATTHSRTNRRHTGLGHMPIVGSSFVPSDVPLLPNPLFQFRELGTPDERNSNNASPETEVDGGASIQADEAVQRQPLAETTPLPSIQNRNRPW